MNKDPSHIHQSVSVCLHLPVHLFSSLLSTSSLPPFSPLLISHILLSSPVLSFLSPSYRLISSPPFSFPSSFLLAHSTVTHLLFLYVYLWNMSVLVNMDLYMHACPHCITVYNEQARVNHYANETISHTFPNLHWIHYKSTIYDTLPLFLFLSVSVWLRGQWHQWPTSRPLCGVEWKLCHRQPFQHSR